jgi:hypothetical protein
VSGGERADQANLLVVVEQHGLGIDDARDGVCRAGLQRAGQVLLGLRLGILGSRERHCGQQQRRRGRQSRLVTWRHLCPTRDDWAGGRPSRHPVMPPL